MAVIDIAGQRFGRLVADSFAGKNKHEKAMCKCTCDCGQEATVVGSSLRSGFTKSCGCLNLETVRKPRKHGHSTGGRTPEYRCWRALIARCHTKNCDDYPQYGGRGIEVCDRWLSFQAFLDDMGPRPSLRHSVDRKDTNGNYEPSNCRWATPKEQANNTRRSRMIEYRGETKTFAQWADELGFDYDIIHSRVQRGWTVERAFEQPIKRKNGGANGN